MIEERGQDPARSLRRSYFATTALNTTDGPSPRHDWDYRRTRPLGHFVREGDRILHHSHDFRQLLKLDWRIWP
jgi:hypothetical protein